MFDIFCSLEKYKNIKGPNIKPDNEYVLKNFWAKLLSRKSIKENSPKKIKYN